MIAYNFKEDCMNNLKEKNAELKKRINDARKGIEMLKSKGILSYRKKVKPWNIIKINTLEKKLNQLELDLINSPGEKILNKYEEWLEDIETIIYVLLGEMETIISVQKKTLQPKPQTPTPTNSTLKGYKKMEGCMKIIGKTQR
jgi:predicted RNase H-like nuclease (RuvC/YqgF family)